MSSSMAECVVPAGRLTTWEAVRRFVYAGNATFTLRSGQERYTYRVRKPKDTPESLTRYGSSWFVSLLRGPSNEDDYAYMGVIDNKGFHATKNSRMGLEARSWKWFARFFVLLAEGKDGDVPPTLEFWHESRCGRCGRKLTVPESVESGLGPECAGRMG